jgi:hypothetical protein
MRVRVLHGQQLPVSIVGLKQSSRNLSNGDALQQEIDTYSNEGQTHYSKCPLQPDLISFPATSASEIFCDLPPWFEQHGNAAADCADTGRHAEPPVNWHADGTRS